MWICKRILFAPPFARVCFIRRDHTAVTNGGRGLGNLNEVREAMVRPSYYVYVKCCKGLLFRSIRTNVNYNYMFHIVLSVPHLTKYIRLTGSLIMVIRIATLILSLSVRSLLLLQEVNQRFRKRTLERLHRWDGMSGNDWFMIYRDNYASRFILLVTMAVPVIGFLTSENCMADVKDGRLWDAFKDTNIVRQVLLFLSNIIFTYVDLMW